MPDFTRSAPMIWTDETDPNDLRQRMIYALLDYHGTDQEKRWMPCVKVVTRVSGDEAEGVVVKTMGSALGIRYAFADGRFLTSAESLASRDEDLTDDWQDVLGFLDSPGPPVRREPA